MVAKNELAVNLDAAASTAVAETADVDVDMEVEGVGLESDMEVPDTDFWSNGEDDDQVSSEDDGEEVSEDSAPEAGQPRTIKYVADGKEVEVDLEEAKKRLSLYEGSRKAFSEATTLKKRAEKLTKERDELKTNWDKLETLKHDHEKLWKAITGNDFQSFLDQEVAKRSEYLEASPAEQAAIDRERAALRATKQAELERAQLERERKKAEEDRYSADKTQLNVKLQQEFSKYQFPDVDAEMSNRLKKMVWRNAIADIKEYKETYGKLTDKMISKAFSDNATAITQTYEKQVENGVKQATEKKKKVAKEKAQIASSRNYKDLVSEDLVKKNPLDLFHAFGGKKR